MQQILSTSLLPENFCFKFNDFHQPVRFIFFRPSVQQPQKTNCLKKKRLNVLTNLEKALVF